MNRYISSVRKKSMSVKKRYKENRVAVESTVPSHNVNQEEEHTPNNMTQRRKVSVVNKIKFTSNLKKDFLQRRIK